MHEQLVQQHSGLGHVCIIHFAPALTQTPDCGLKSTLDFTSSFLAICCKVPLGFGVVSAHQEICFCKISKVAGTAAVDLKSMYVACRWYRLVWRRSHVHS